jgi:beta-lactamase class A
MKSRFYYFICFLLCLMTILNLCYKADAQKKNFGKPAKQQNNLLEIILKKYPAYFDHILQNRDSFRVQIIYTQINRDAKNKPSFRNYYFNVSDSHYFYPASTVKMPVAFLALQKLNELKIAGLDKNSTMITESGYSGQTKTFNDASSPDGRPTIAQYIKKIFLVSDNEAFNRLYEFLGQEYINTQLAKMGYGNAQIRHRLQVALNADENAHTNPINFYDANGNLLFGQPMQLSSQKFADRNDFVGSGYYQGSKLINQPMDFSQKNRISLEDLHNILKTVIFPGAVDISRRFRLTKDDYKFLYQYMSQYPAETKFPSYDTLKNWDAYCKFLYWGSDTGQLPKNIRMFNKVGDAYGFLIDVSYFVDFSKKVEFMLSASIYCNKDGILNDDKYDYEEVGYPFMKQLGRVIYDYELKRKKSFLPDLSGLRIKYDQ